MVGKRPAVSELAVVTVLRDAGFSVGQQQTKPRAGSASGPPRGQWRRVCYTASAGESKRHWEALSSEGIIPVKVKPAVGLAWPGFVVPVMADLLE